MKLHWTDEDKKLISEISILYGINSQVVEEIFEYQYLYFISKFLKSQNKSATYSIPLIGNLFVRLNDEKLTDNGIEVDVDAFISLNESFKKALVELVNQNESNSKTILDNLIDTKIKKLIMDIVEE